MRYGFIGCGNMGSAIAKALAHSTQDILLSDRSGKGAALSDSLGCRYGTAKEAAACDYVFLGVKPQGMAAVLQELIPVFQEKKPVLISMAAGMTVSTIEALASGNLPVIRIMPNTPVAVGKGVIQYCHNALVTDDALQEFLQDLSPAGLLDPIDENLMDAATSVSGCGPAFAYLFLDALAQGGAACGLPLEKATQYAAQTLIGAAEMVKATGLSPKELADKVCSPGGSTIEGVKVLENQGLAATVMDCVNASFERNKQLGKSFPDPSI